MNITSQNIPITMSHPNLAEAPTFASPAGYSIRSYSPGDEHVWVRIQLAADLYNEISLELFRREFGDDPELLKRRQFFLIDPAGESVGTATAWFDENHRGRPFGRVHWVAVVPECQGRGLSKPLLSEVCAALRELGHEEAYLTTSTVRVAAIRLYMRFGFVPEVNSEEDARVWQEMEGYLSR